VGALVVGVVTKPRLRGQKEADEVRRQKASLELKKQVDALIVIPNSRVLNLSEKKDLRARCVQAGR
jgi:cell division GTPase FtsZ